ncbi:hypothetical protein DL96DRAFT_1785274 [Flagelloscypha sp. PMI_526]|nr:hypothetical protein DL96DRAFT_1785274 [Flagelloscypha sp. PMI_526]
MRRLASVFGKLSDRKDADASSHVSAPSKLSIVRGSTPSIPVLITSHNSSASSASIRTPDVEDDMSNVSAQRPGLFCLTLHSPEVDDENEADGDDYGPPDPPAPTKTSSSSLPGITRGKDSFRELTQSKIAFRSTPAPLLLPADDRWPAFPSSSHPYPQSARQESLASRMFRLHLLARLNALSLDDERMLSDFPHCGTTLDSEPPCPLDSVADVNARDAAIPKTLTVASLNPAVGRWISRPCFEDRFVSFIADGETVNVTPVTASFAVAALEWSELLDHLAAPPEPPRTQQPPDQTQPVSDLDQKTSLPDVRSTPEPSSGAQSKSAPIATTNAQADSLPSPIHTSASTATVTARRGVRFAEDGKDDIPLGYAVRRKQQQAAKAKFLQDEKERRMFEAERARVAEERRRRDLERAEWERERMAWEAEKRAIEEERRQRQYAANFAAARQRQEHSRAGGSDSPKYLTPSGSHQSLHEIDTRPSGYKRFSSSSSPASQGSSPGAGSRPASLNIPSPHEGSYGHSRPSSPHSSSSEDSKAREQKNRRRMSSLGTSHSRAPSDRSMSYPTLSQQTFIPPVPIVPNYFDIPLVPPTPPFVLQQYPKRHSRSPESSSHSHKSRNSSSEQLPTSSSSRRQSSSASPHRGSNYGAHQQQSSGENSSSFRRDDRGRPGQVVPRRASQLGPVPKVAPYVQYGTVSSWPPQYPDPSFRPPPSRRRTALS